MAISPRLISPQSELFDFGLWLSLVERLVREQIPAFHGFPRLPRIRGKPQRTEQLITLSLVCSSEQLESQIEYQIGTKYQIPIPDGLTSEICGDAAVCACARGWASQTVKARLIALAIASQPVT
jgi:hypothetical protein